MKKIKVKSKVQVLAVVFTAILVAVTAYFVEGPSETSIYSLIEHSSFKVYGDRGGGTAFLLRDPLNRVRLLTARHVCDGLGKEGVNVLVKGVSYPTEPVKRSESTDLCELKITEQFPINDVMVLVLSENGPNMHDDIYLGGFPGDLNLTISKGLYSGSTLATVADSKAFTATECLEKRTIPVPYGFGYVCTSTFVVGTSTAKAYPGHSGSAVLNSLGQVIGLLAMTSTPSYNGLFITLRELREFLK